MGSVNDVGRDTLELLIAQQENFLDRRHALGRSIEFAFSLRAHVAFAKFPFGIPEQIETAATDSCYVNEVCAIDHFEQGSKPLWTPLSLAS